MTNMNEITNDKNEINPKGENMNKEPLLTIETKKEKTLKNVMKQLNEDTGGTLTVSSKKAKMLSGGRNGRNSPPTKYNQRLHNKENKNPKLVEKDIKSNEEDTNFSIFEGNSEVEWSRIFDKDITDESLITKLKEYSEDVSSAKLDFIKVCMETIQLRSYQFLHDELKKLNYSTSSISKIKKICGNKTIRSYIDILPTSWGTLYSLKNCDERVISELTGYHIENQKFVENEACYSRININSSKSDVDRELAKHIQGEKTEDEICEENTKWFKEWCVSNLEHFSLDSINEAMNRMDYKQIPLFLDWVRKTETMFVQKAFPKDIIVDVRLKQ
jgi:hypothetical protein